MGPDTAGASERSRPRKASLRSTPAPLTSGSAPATTFFLRRETDMQSKSQEQGTKDDILPDSEPLIHSDTSVDMSDSSYGVQSLAETLDGAFPPESVARSSSVDSLASESPLEPSKTPVYHEGAAIASKKRKAGNPIHPKIAAAAQRIISSERPSSRASAGSSPFRVASSTSPYREHVRKASNASLSAPLTPLRLSPNPDSGIPSTPRSASPRSFRLSDEEGSVLDDTGSQAIQSSSGEEEEDETLRQEADSRDTTAGAMIDSVGPQLRMPSITMPSRRPFTERGKRMGRLKVLVAGQAGVGKTSLIKSIVHTCEDIVHVDPTSSGSSFLQESAYTRTKQGSFSGQKDGSYTRTTEITEINASTRAYPAWWSEVEESRVSRRRKSMGDVVLERNLCFIDTPGWSAEGDVQTENAMRNDNATISHLESLLRQNATVGTLSDSELLSLLSGGGGFQVDVVLYLFDSETNVTADLDILHRLSAITNVIPLLGRSDTCTEDVIRDRKQAINATIANANLKPFTFQMPAGASRSPSANLPADTSVILPYAVSSAPGDDAEVMDASLLMSSTYVKPLLPSDLSLLVRNLLEPDNIQWLRHCAVKKFLHWRTINLANSLDLQMQTAASPLIEDTTPASATSGLEASIELSGACSTVSSPSHVLVPYPASSFYRPHSPSPSTQSINQLHGPSDVVLKNFSNHANADCYTKVRLAKWAEDLQRSLDHERRQNQQQAFNRPQGDWPIDVAFKDADTDEQALIKQHQDTKSPNNKSSHQSSTPYTKSSSSTLDPLDPLGVLAFGQQFRRTGWLTLQILGGCGIVGATCLWTIRNWAQVLEFFGFPGMNGGAAAVGREVEIPGYALVGPPMLSAGRHGGFGGGGGLGNGNGHAFAALGQGHGQGQGQGQSWGWGWDFGLAAGLREIVGRF